LRGEWDWRERFVVLYSGNMGLAHEFDTLLDAAEILGRDRRILFAFVGQGPRRAEVEERAKGRGLTNVEFRPYVAREQLGQSLSSADLHVVTLRDRMPGLLVPSKIYGILAAGRPTLYVGPDEGEIAEILRTGGCGARIAIGDAQGLADAITAYAADDERRREHGRLARRLFEERFTREQGVEAFTRLLGAGAA
jgi:glycosyltransferase involved in cell wall biosynthesis